jgi:hypothetical protein
MLPKSQKPKETIFGVHGKAFSGEKANVDSRYYLQNLFNK